MTGSPYAKFAVFLAFLLGCDVASSQLLVPFAGNVTLNPDDNVPCDSEYMCVENKCNQARWCRQVDGKWVQWALITCDETTNERYCNNGICTKDPLPRCIAPSDFMCPTPNGIYPDPLSCTRYHICVNGVATTNNCPTNNVYDHELGSCKYRRIASDCVLFQCANRKDGHSVVYPRDDRIYGKCFSGKAYIFGQCQEHERYNLDGGKCERYCRSAGTQPPEPGNCGKFILCAEIAPRRYQPVEMSCGCDQAYDENEKRCVLDAPCVKNNTETWCIHPKLNVNGSNEEESNEGGSNGGESNGGESNGGESNGGESNGGESSSESGNGKAGTLVEEAPAVLVNNVANSNCNGNRQLRNVRRRSISSKRANKSDNSNSDTGNVPSTLVTDNPDDNNNILCDDNDNADGNLINANDNGNNDNTNDNGNNDNTNDNGNNDNTYDNSNNNNNENFGMKQRENFVRFIFDWIIRIIVGQPA